MKSIQKFRIEDSMTELLINVMAFKKISTGNSISTGRRWGKATLALNKPSCIMNQKSPNHISNTEDLPSHQLNNELNYVGNSDNLKHNLATVLSTSPEGSVLTKAIDISSWMLTNAVCRN